MCRMFLIISEGDKDRKIPKMVLNSFKNAAYFDKYLKREPKQHPHGWGCVAFNLINTAQSGFVYRSKKPAFNDKMLINIVNSDVFDQKYLFLAHARKASPGTPIKLAQVHPFEKSINDEIIYLAHNGTISRDFLKKKFQIESEGLSDTQMFIEIIKNNLPHYKSLSDLIKDIDLLLVSESRKDPKVFTAAQFLVTIVKRDNIQVFVQSLINTNRVEDDDTERLLDYYAIYLAKIEYENVHAVIAASSTIFHYLEEEHNGVIKDFRRLENGEYIEAEGEEILSSSFDKIIKHI